MKIKDLENNVIEVTDLEKAIEQATEFVSYDGSEQLQRYWIHFLVQLKKIKNRVEKSTHNPKSYETDKR